MREQRVGVEIRLKHVDTRPNTARSTTGAQHNTASGLHLQLSTDPATRKDEKEGGNQTRKRKKKTTEGTNPQPPTKQLRRVVPRLFERYAGSIEEIGFARGEEDPLLRGTANEQRDVRNNRSSSNTSSNKHQHSPGPPILPKFLIGITCLGTLLADSTSHNTLIPNFLRVR